MIRKQSKLFGRQHAFTLLEIIIATTIATIILASVMATFHTAVKAYRMGTGHNASEQNARYAMNQIVSDLRNLFYLDPNNYNKYRRQIEQQVNSQLQAALQSGMKEEDFFATQDMPDLGPELDLSFSSEDGGNLDSLSFIYSQHMTRFDDRMPWSLARVKYSVEDGKLMRSLNNCFAASTDALGNEVASPEAPTPDPLAENVESFNLEFGYWFNGEWLTAPSWDSNLQNFRNPPPEENPDDQTITDASGNKVSAQPSTAQQALNPNGTDPTQMKNLPDGVPAWVRITLEMKDSLNSERKRKYVQTVQMYQSQETYIPEDETDTDVRRRSTAARGTKKQ